MPCIEVQGDLIRRPEVEQLAGMLGVSRNAVVGLCVECWSAIVNTPEDDDCFVGGDRPTVDLAVGHPGLTEALIAVGWLVITERGVCLPPATLQPNPPVRKCMDDSDQ